MDNKKYFDTIIFGGNGQDGYLMARYLIKQKKKVLAITRKKDKKLKILKNKKKLFLDIFICEKYNVQNYLKLLKKFKFKNIFFFAGYSKMPQNEDEKKKCINANYLIFKNLLETCLKVKIKPKILYASSGEIFGSRQFRKRKENSIFRADNCYAKCKMHSINLINKFRKLHKFFIVNAICYNHESIFTPKSHLLRKIIILLKDKKKSSIKIYNPNEERNISHVYDFLPLFQKSMNVNTGEDYVFANSSNISIRQIVNFINKIYRKKIIFVYKKNKNISRMADNTKIKKIFNYKPKFSTDKILIRMLSYQKNNSFIK